MKTDSEKLNNWAVGVFWSVVVVVSVAITGTLFHGCRLASPDPQPTQTTNTVRRWSQSIVMSFPQPPTEGTAALLKLAKIKERSDRVYVLELWDMHDQLQNTAIQTSLREGAVLVSQTP